MKPSEGHANVAMGLRVRGHAADEGVLRGERPDISGGNFLGGPSGKARKSVTLRCLDLSNSAFGNRFFVDETRTTAAELFMRRLPLWTPGFVEVQRVHESGELALQTRSARCAAPLADWALGFCASRGTQHLTAMRALAQTFLASELVLTWRRSFMTAAVRQFGTPVLPPHSLRVKPFVGSE